MSITNLSALRLPSYRQATASDYSISIKVSAQAYLPGTELNFLWQINGSCLKRKSELKAATDAYNEIKAVATAKELAFVDINALLTQVATTGFTANGFTVTAAFI
jgi:hypothetical protein